MLEYIPSPVFDPLHQLSLRDLTRQTFFLVTLASAKRVSELQASFELCTFLLLRLQFSSFRSFWRTLGLRYAPSHALFHPISEFVTGLSDELLLCPVRALSEYVASTSRVVNRPRRPFVSSRCSSRVISKYRIFFLLREGILYCRQLQRCCGAHSFPDLATSAFFKNGLLTNFFIAPS